MEVAFEYREGRAFALGRLQVEAALKRAAKRGDNWQHGPRSGSSRRQWREQLQSQSSYASGHLLDQLGYMCESRAVEEATTVGGSREDEGEEGDGLALMQNAGAATASTSGGRKPST